MIQPRHVAAAIGDLTRLFSFAFLVPIPVAWWLDEADLQFGGVGVPSTVLAFVAGFTASTVVWMLLAFYARDADEEVRDREGYVAVALGWIVVTLLAMLPFLLSGHYGPVDAFFESMSGLTTTGASSLPAEGFATLPPSLFFWRGLLQWLGGLGIIVLLVALLSKLTQQGLPLFQAEASGHLSTRLRPKLTSTARTLWTLYAGLTAAMVVVLWFLLARSGLEWRAAAFESVVHIFTTISTGGFSSQASSIGAFGDPWVEAFLVVCMLIGGTNFALLFLFKEGHLVRLWRDPQWRFYVSVYVAGAVVLWGMLVLKGQNLWPSLRGASFSMASLYTGTGYTNVDYSAWPTAARALLLLVMLMGGNAGSTAGGLKTIRILILVKVVVRELRRLLHPRAVIPIRLGRRTLDESAVATTVAFFFLYLAIWVASTILLAFWDPALDLESAAAAASSGIGNVGVGLGAVGPSGSYAQLVPASKILLSLLMWIGRLELFTAMLVFLPATWRN